MDFDRRVAAGIAELIKFYPNLVGEDQRKIHASIQRAVARI